MLLNLKQSLIRRESECEIYCEILFNNSTDDTLYMAKLDYDLLDKEFMNFELYYIGIEEPIEDFEITTEEKKQIEEFILNTEEFKEANVFLYNIEGLTKEEYDLIMDALSKTEMSYRIESTKLENIHQCAYFSECAKRLAEFQKKIIEELTR